MIEAPQWGLGCLLLSLWSSWTLKVAFPLVMLIDLRGRGVSGPSAMLIGKRGYWEFVVPPILPLYPPPGLVALVHQLLASVA